jgi:hypothetical protein
LRAGFSFASESNARAVFDSGRNRNLQTAFSRYRSGSVADAARIPDDPASAAAIGACPLNDEEPLLRPHLAGSLASWANVPVLSLVFRTGPVTGVAHNAGRHPQGNLRSRKRLGQVDLDALAQIGPSPGTTALPAHKPEHLVENVAEPSASEVESSGKPSWPAALLESGVTVAVIRRSLLLVPQNVVCFANFLKPRFGLLVAGIAVRVVLHRELAIRFLQLVSSRVPIDA